MSDRTAARAMKEPKPCPFCGNDYLNMGWEVYFTREQDDLDIRLVYIQHAVAGVWCDRCGAGVEVGLDSLDDYRIRQSEAIDRWNRRAEA